MREQPHASFGFDAGMNWHYQLVVLALGPCGIHTSQGAHGVVVSHPLRMRKALGSNPSVSMFSEHHKPGITNWSLGKVSLPCDVVLNSVMSTRSCCAEEPLV